MNERIKLVEQYFEEEMSVSEVARTIWSQSQTSPERPWLIVATVASTVDPGLRFSEDLLHPARSLSREQQVWKRRYFDNKSMDRRLSGWERRPDLCWNGGPSGPYGLAPYLQEDNYVDKVNS